MIILYILAGLLALVLLYILFLFICALAADPHKEYEDHSRFYRRLLNGATAAGMKLLRIHVHVTGLDKIPSDRKPVFVCNHRSNFDPIVTWYALKKWDIAFISKASNFKIPIFGRLIRKCCFMAIDRENPRNAIKTIQKAAGLLRKGEVSVGVYPEGTRSKTGELLPFHNGVFKIAQKAQAPVVVLSISGTEKIHKNYPFRASHVYLDVVEVMDAEEIVHKKTEEIGGAARTAIADRLQKIEQKEKKENGKSVCSL